MELVKKCKNCGNILERKRKAGKLESARDFRRRDFCCKRCSSKYQHNGVSSLNEQVKEAESDLESKDESSHDKASAFLIDVFNNKLVDMTTRVNAAKALLPYQEKKANEIAGKKEQQAEAAKEAGAGFFGPRTQGVATNIQ